MLSSSFLCMCDTILLVHIDTFNVRVLQCINVEKKRTEEEEEEGNRTEMCVT